MNRVVKTGVNWRKKLNEVHTDVFIFVLQHFSVPRTSFGVGGEGGGVSKYRVLATVVALNALKIKASFSQKVPVCKGLKS